MNKKQRNRNRETSRLLYNKIVQNEAPLTITSLMGKIKLEINTQQSIYERPILKAEPYWIGGQIVCYDIVN
jgi:hypothetical protein